MRSSEGSRSVWKDQAVGLEFVPLREDLRADVCVVGAGIAGMTVAYFLGRAGKRVVVLDDGPVGGGETGQTTAHLASALDDRFFELERLHGRDGARLAYESHQAAIERFEEVAREEGIDCDLRRLDGYLVLAPGDDEDLLEREREAARRAGFHDVERLERVPVAPWESGPCLRFPRQGRFHPRRFLAGLARALHRQGGHVFTGSHVTEVEGGDDARVRTEDGFTVRCDAVAVCTNSPMNDLVAMHTKQEPYRTFVIAAPVPAGSVPDALYWDTADPYRYVRLQRVGGAGTERELLIVGGEDERTGVAQEADERYRRLEAWARLRFPIGEVELRWSGQVLEPVDRLGFIGRNPLDAGNVFIATGDSGHGMTHGMIAGMLISDLVLGRENPWAELYDPGRVSLRAAREFVRANLKVAAHYTEWLRGAPDEVAAEADVAPGTGAILRSGLAPVAVYRDEAGALHRRSAVCTHLGCIVHWNREERSWDCPCHGSRFAPTGEVLNGPAHLALPPVEEER
jgi:glycine/D-amino acid oxidase-like deaminating enzyme/nitrite reductase/ring-hydroxylating ferredoxin subunit